MKTLLNRWLRRSIFRVGPGMRGRVHKISIIAGGEVSIVIRCGLDEPRARQLLQGTLVEFFETRDGIPPKADEAWNRVQNYGAAPDADAGPSQSNAVLDGPAPAGDGCTCHAPGGYPHEPDCGWWEADKARRGAP